MTAAAATPDPMDLLQSIHRDVRLLRELAGDALVIEIRPAAATTAPDVGAAVVPFVPSPPTAVRPGRSVSPERKRDVFEVFEAWPAEWLPPREIAARAGMTAAQVRDPLAVLLETGKIASNGKGTRARAYRLLVDPDDETVAARAARRAQAAAAKQERDELTAIAPSGAGTLLGVALDVLVSKPQTVAELAATMRIERDLAVRVVQQLEDDGDVEPRGRDRRGLIIYGGNR